MAAAPEGRKNLTEVIAAARSALGSFETRLNEFAAVLEELHAQALAEKEQEGWQ